MKKIKLKKKALIVLLFLLFICISLITILGVGIYFTTPVSSKEDLENIIIEPGSTSSDIAELLKENNIIKNETVFKLFLKLKKVDNIYAASYYFSESMNLNEVIDTLKEGGHNVNEIAITFREGINMMEIAKIIEENTNNKKEDVYKTLKDTKYIDSLIEEYWFLTKDIKNKEIYYSLEGYLFPETYFLSSKDVTVSEIFKVMLNETDKVLTPYKEKIEKSSYSIHKLMTLASITQSEGVNSDDFKTIASVFYNRLEDNTPLGSCVTSYYGVKKSMTEELYQKDIDSDNAYNTRGSNPKIISVGPISNPGLKAIDAILDPIETDYYFFVSDKNRKLYFTKTNSEHERMIAKLQRDGLWYEW